MTLAANAPDRIKRLVASNRQFVTYTAIGACGVLLDLLVFFALFNWVGVHEIVATAISTTLAITNSFVLNARYNFKRHDQLLRRFFRFYLVGLGGLGLTALMLLVLCTGMDFDPNVVKVLSLPFVLVLQFTLNKRWSFG